MFNIPWWIRIGYCFIINFVKSIHNTLIVVYGHGELGTKLIQKKFSILPVYDRILHRVWNICLPTLQLYRFRKGFPIYHFGVALCINIVKIVWGITFYIENTLTFKNSWIPLSLGIRNLMFLQCIFAVWLEKMTLLCHWIMKGLLQDSNCLSTILQDLLWFSLQW